MASSGHLTYPRNALDEIPLFIVLNTGSGSGDAHEAVRTIEQVLTASRRSFELLPIDAPAKLECTAQRAAELALRHAGAIVVAGGDGTINTVAQAALPTGRPFGIIPQGTFNYSSRAHGIPLDTRAAVQALLKARIKPVQVGCVNDAIFLVNASVGLYPQLLEDREWYKQHFGRKRIVALWSGLVTLMREHRQLLLEIEHDRQPEIVRTPTLFVGNNSLQLEQVGLPESEDVEHRRLAAIIVKPVSTPAMLWLAIRGALGQLGDESRIRNFAFRRMVVQLPARERGRRVKVATDGEIRWMSPPLEFKVASQPLMLMVPAEGTDAS